MLFTVSEVNKLIYFFQMQDLKLHYLYSCESDFYDLFDDILALLFSNIPNEN